MVGGRMPEWGDAFPPFGLAHCLNESAKRVWLINLACSKHFVVQASRVGISSRGV